MGEEAGHDVPHRLMNPGEFTWRGLHHAVCRVVGHRRVNEETWRVQALARGGYPGVFDLCFDWTAGRWSVTRISILELEGLEDSERTGSQARSNGEEGEI